jgi:Fic family protein
MGQPGVSVAFDWHGRTAQAWLPAPLSARVRDLSAATVRRTERARAALSSADDGLPAAWEPLARLILRTEGIASSSIEGVRGRLEDIALAQIAPATGDVAWVADNLAVVESALDERTLTVEVLHAWHRRLMVHGHLPPHLVGTFRDRPGWIGGTSPLDAVYVPPPAAEVPRLIQDLLAVALAPTDDPVTLAALVHGQFETVHPYGDGNGRLGRILIGWVLRHHDVVRRLPPPISVMVARDAGGYLSGLWQFRHGSLDSWVRWFAETAERAGTGARLMIEEVAAVLAAYTSRCADLRADAAAVRAIPLLPRSPVLDAGRLAELLGVSDRAARRALIELGDRDVMHRIVGPPGRGRPTQWWAATALLDTSRRWVA